MASVSRSGPMVPVTRVSGGSTRPVGEENSGTLMAMYLRENGSRTKQMDTESILI